jgi:hypothetical protein
MTAVALGRRGEFYCYNCGRFLVYELEGHYKIVLHCDHCKAKITLELREALTPAASPTSAPASASAKNGSPPATPASTGRST